MGRVRQHHADAPGGLGDPARGCRLRQLRRAYAGGGPRRRVGRAGAPRDHLGRYPRRSRMRPPDRPDRHGARVRADRSSTRPDLHALEALLGPGPRAGGLGARGDRAPGQGSPGPAPDGPAGHRALRCLGHERLRPAPGGLVGGVARGGRDRPRRSPGGRPVGDDRGRDRPVLRLRRAAFARGRPWSPAEGMEPARRWVPVSSRSSRAPTCTWVRRHGSPSHRIDLFAIRSCGR